MFTKNERHLIKNFFRFALPAVASMVMSALYTVVDGIFVGRFVGEEALAAINIAFPYIMVQIAFTMMIAVGGANIFSRNMGKGEEDEAKKVYTQSMSALAAVGVVLNVAAIIFAAPMGRLLGSDDNLLADVVEYIRWFAIFGIIFMPGLGFSVFIRNDNAPKLEFIGTVTGAVINIVLDYLFIGVFKWGIRGAAVASGIGQMISVAIYATHLFNKNRTLILKKFKLKIKEFLQIFHGGLPSFLMEFSQSAITISFNIAIMAKIGSLGVSAYSIVMYVCSIFNMVLVGFVQGAQPLMSFNHGCKNAENVVKVHRLGIFCNLAATLVFFVAVLIFGRQISMLFITDNAAVTDMAERMMNLYFLGFFPLSITLMNILYFQTTERINRSLIISLLRCVGFLQLFLLVLPMFWGNTGIYISYLFAELCVLIVSMFFFIKPKPKAAATE